MSPSPSPTSVAGRSSDPRSAPGRCGCGVGDHQRVVLVGGVGVARTPSPAMLVPVTSTVNGPLTPAGRKTFSRLLRGSAVAAGDRAAAGEHVAQVGVATGVHRQVEVVDEGVAGRRPRRVGPRERHLERLGCVGDRVGAPVALAGGGRTWSSDRRTRARCRRGSSSGSPAPSPGPGSGGSALVPPAPSAPPTSSVAVLTRIALVIAGDGAVPPDSSRAYQSRTSAARPETSGAACEVPETSV